MVRYFIQMQGLYPIQKSNHVLGLDSKKNKLWRQVLLILYHYQIFFSHVLGVFFLHDQNSLR